jgi:hypothetical protein
MIATMVSLEKEKEKKDIEIVLFIHSSHGAAICDMVTAASTRQAC